MNVISGFLAKARVGREEPMDHWSWESQNKWKGRCKSTLMQSPINLTKSNVKKVSKAFNVAYNFLPVYTMMKRNEKEIIATFMNFGGTVQLSIGGTFVLFTPTYMSFRFPGEHMFEGRRYMGEIILHLVEMSSQRKNSVSNGLNITIPIKPSKSGLNISSFERLNIDFWRYEVEKKGTYTPKKFLKKTTCF
jgi:carbonic anhydrase